MTAASVCRAFGAKSRAKSMRPGADRLEGCRQSGNIVLRSPFMTNSAAADQAFLADYAAFATDAALADFRDRTQIELTGEDRAQVLAQSLHGRDSQAASGGGLRSPADDGSGQSPGPRAGLFRPRFARVGNRAGPGRKILTHLDRYLIREQVVLADRSLEWAEWLLVGPRAAAIIERLTGAAVPSNLLASQPARLGDCEVWVRSVDLAGSDGFLIDCHRADAEQIGQHIASTGARRVGPGAVEARRIEAGFPRLRLGYFRQESAPGACPRQSRDQLH